MQTEKKAMGRQHQGMDWLGVRQVPEGSGDQRKMEETGCEVVCGASTTLEVKEQVMMMVVNYSVHMTVKVYANTCTKCSTQLKEASLLQT